MEIFKLLGVTGVGESSPKYFVPENNWYGGILERLGWLSAEVSVELTRRMSVWVFVIYAKLKMPNGIP